MNKIFKAVAIVLAIMFLSSCDENIDSQGTDIEVPTSDISQLPKSTTTVASTSEIITTEATTTDYADYAEYWAMYEGYQKDCYEFIRSEHVGGICIGMEYDSVIEALGEPCELGEIFDSDDGLTQIAWFSEKNIMVYFLVKDNKKTVHIYAFNSNTTATTSSGITIGSSRQEVIDVYGDRISINESAYSLGYDYFQYDQIQTQFSSWIA